MTPASTATRRTRAAHLGPDRRRPQILDAALDIAAERGVGAVTIASVAQRLQVTRPVVYSCFEDRAGLIAALTDREEEYLGVHRAAALRDRVVDADVDVFVEGFRAILEVVAARPQAWRLVYGHPDPDVAQYFGAWRRATEQRCAELLRPTLAAWGTVDAEVKLPVLVELWVSAGEGAVRTLLGGTGWTPESLGAVAGAAVFRAFRGA